MNWVDEFMAFGAKESEFVSEGTYLNEATVEARHASYLNLINRAVPFPAAFDTPVAPRKICETVREAFITSAPKPYGPYRSLAALCDRLPNRATPR
jgi:hypothetical protein